MSLMQKLKELIKLSDLCNFQLFASSIGGNISHQTVKTVKLLRLEINCFLKVYVLNKDAIFPETVEFSGKIRSQVLQVALETNCTCGFHLIA